MISTTFPVSNSTFNDNMLSRKKTLQSILLTMIPFLATCSAFQVSSCIRYETYAVADYKMTPFDSRDAWFSNSFHFTPRKLTRVGLRSRRLFGCCDTGYQYKVFPIFGCQPVCSSPCPENSHCSEPGQCSCDVEYHLSGSDCVSNNITTVEHIQTTTVENKSVELTCKASCATNEQCSTSNNICICRNGFQRSGGDASASCVRKCVPQCAKYSHCSENGQCSCDDGYHNVSGSECVSNQRTTEEYIQATTTENTSVQLPCNGLCGTNEECSISDNVCICRDGFQRSAGKLSVACVPKCEPQCQNSDCTAPNTCECWPHYERTNNNSCHLQCSELSCTYGECDENGTCVCAQGFLNNGTTCIWAGDAILSEPDNCDCWSKFVWQKNRTEGGGRHCLSLCDGDDSIEVASECITFKQCQFYEGFLVCHTQMYKCSAMEKPNSTVSIKQNHAKQATEDNGVTSKQLTLLIVAFLAIVLIVGAILWVWQKRRGSLNRLFSYGHMESGEEEEQI